jgi:threonine dehydratase
MPDNTAQAKRAAVSRYGAEVRYCEPTLAAREATARAVVEATGAAFIHPYDNLMVMAGQGTAAAELLEQVPQLDAIVCPVGGGGLLSGTAVAAKALKPGIRIIGAEPAGADDAARSFESGQLQPAPQARTIADGLRGALAARTFIEIQAHVDAITRVSEAEIIAGMRRLWEVLKIIVEPSAAVPYAAVQGGYAGLEGRHVGIVLTGANLDLDRLPWMQP